MKGDSLNLRRSKVLGENTSTFALAFSSCSFAVLRPLCSDWKQIPGIRNGVPNSTSAVDVAVSDFGAFRIPNNTHGSDRDHDSPALPAHRSAFFNVR